MASEVKVNKISPASGTSFQEILDLYPYLEDEDIKAALSYATWRTEEYDLTLQVT